MAEAVAAWSVLNCLQRRPERRGQDRRYALADAVTRSALEWEPRVSMEEGLERTVCGTATTAMRGRERVAAYAGPPCSKPALRP